VESFGFADFITRIRIRISDADPDSRAIDKSMLIHPQIRITDS
jgi:hypothetical protein